jgi:tetratricopeptide (TPR) repeat protein
MSPRPLSGCAASLLFRRKLLLCCAAIAALTVSCVSWRTAADPRAVAGPGGRLVYELHRFYAFPSHPSAFRVINEEAYRELGRRNLGEAAFLCSRLVALYPDNGYALNNRAYVRELQGDAPGAVDDYIRAWQITRDERVRMNLRRIR